LIDPPQILEEVLSLMKEVKAYVRCQKVESVIETLEAAGIDGITIIDVMGLGPLADPSTSKYSIECVERYSDVAKIEVVCADEEGIVSWSSSARQRTRECLATGSCSCRPWR
jgi:hypothetical protein